MLPLVASAASAGGNLAIIAGKGTSPHSADGGDGGRFTW